MKLTNIKDRIARPPDAAIKQANGNYIWDYADGRRLERQPGGRCVTCNEHDCCCVFSQTLSDGTQSRPHPLTVTAVTVGSTDQQLQGDIMPNQESAQKLDPIRGQVYTHRYEAVFDSVIPTGWLVFDREYERGDGESCKKQAFDGVCQSSNPIIAVCGIPNNGDRIEVFLYAGRGAVSWRVIAPAKPDTVSAPDPMQGVTFDPGATLRGTFDTFKGRIVSLTDGGNGGDSFDDQIHTKESLCTRFGLPSQGDKMELYRNKGRNGHWWVVGWKILGRAAPETAPAPRRYELRGWGTVDPDPIGKDTVFVPRASDVKDTYEKVQEMLTRVAVLMLGEGARAVYDYDDWQIVDANGYAHLKRRFDNAPCAARGGIEWASTLPSLTLDQWEVLSGLRDQYGMQKINPFATDTVSAPVLCPICQQNEADVSHDLAKVPRCCEPCAHEINHVWEVVAALDKAAYGKAAVTTITWEEERWRHLCEEPSGGFSVPHLTLVGLVKSRLKALGPLAGRCGASGLEQATASRILDAIGQAMADMKWNFWELDPAKTPIEEVIEKATAEQLDWLRGNDCGWWFSCTIRSRMDKILPGSMSIYPDDNALEAALTGSGMFLRRPRVGDPTDWAFSLKPEVTK